MLVLSVWILHTASFATPAKKPNKNCLSVGDGFDVCLSSPITGTKLPILDLDASSGDGRTLSDRPSFSDNGLTSVGFMGVLAARLGCGVRKSDNRALFCSCV